ncbi:uncharacterized protein LOC142616409 [Castanea sativa]|uniref:uncharacterized protein LOC142616409 n=1 Tax=Castanea sativa TaxID=21020 RepID=UPI003F650316
MNRFLKAKAFQVARGENWHVDSLATLASLLTEEVPRLIKVKLVVELSIKVGAGVSMITISRRCWMDPIVNFLAEDQEPDDEKEAVKVHRVAARYWLSADRKLYQRSFGGPYLQCLHPDKVDELLIKPHEGVCGSHVGGRSLAHQAMTQEFRWPQMQKDATEYVRKCVQCQKHASLIHQPVGSLNPISSPWPFAQWGPDIVDPFPRATGNCRFVIVIVDYFTKWVEAEALANIRNVDVKKFVWKNIVTRLEVPKSLRNGQAEATNKAIINRLNRRLEGAKGKWAEELSNVLWAYRTTPRRSTGETPFSLTYRAKAVISTEVNLCSAWAESFVPTKNNELMVKHLDLLEECREFAIVRLVEYQ